MLPWAAFSEGVPPSAWWKDERFEAAIDRWRRRAVVDRAPPLPSLAQQFTALAQTAAPRRAVRRVDALVRLREIDKHPWHWPG